jgi:hypothetical protein
MYKSWEGPFCNNRMWAARDETTNRHRHRGTHTKAPENGQKRCHGNEQKRCHGGRTAQTRRAWGGIESSCIWDGKRPTPPTPNIQSWYLAHAYAGIKDLQGGVILWHVRGRFATVTMTIWCRSRRDTQISRFALNAAITTNMFCTHRRFPTRPSFFPIGRSNTSPTQSPVSNDTFPV